MNPRPLGYATVEEFEQHLDAGLAAPDRTAAELYLRTAEEVVTYHTGGREFLPVKPTLYTAATDVATTLSLTTGADRLPQGGYLLVGDEVVQYGGITQYPDHSDIAVVSRGAVGTTAAAHDLATAAYSVRGFLGDGKSLFPGDFLQLVRLWTGWPSWIEVDTTYVVPEPQDALPYQWITEGGTYSRGARIWMAAVWGYSYTVPYGIKQATMRIAEEVFRRRGSHWTIVSQVQMENVATRFRDATVLPQDVQQILNTFRRIRL